VREPDLIFIGQLELAISAELECHAGGKQMAMLHPVRKACPACGKPMSYVRRSFGTAAAVCVHQLQR
jgi:hypothetical protein